MHHVNLGTIGNLAALASASLLLASTGCARPEHPPAASAENAAHAAAPARAIPITFTVARGDAKTDTLSGRSVLQRGPLRIESDDDRTHVQASLELFAVPNADGTVTIEARYKERDGATRIDWAPSMRLAPHAAATADLRGDGWSRALKVALE